MTTSKDNKGASVKFPPPLVFIISMLFAYGLSVILEIQVGAYGNCMMAIGLAFIILGISILITASILFKRAKTNIEPWKPTSNIISSGIFAYSRNPIYVAFCIIVIGFGLAINNYLVTFSFIPSIIIVFYIAIKKEEAYLENKFGEEYKSYKSKVRRWL